MIDHSVRHSLFILTRLISFALATVFVVAAAMFWSTTSAAANANNLVCLLALLVFATLPRQYLEMFLVRLAVLGLALAAQVVNVVGLVHSIRNVGAVGTGPIVVQAVVALVLLAMLAEALAGKDKHVAV